MILEFWGTRGTFPVAGKEYPFFGGATSCASLRADPETFYIIDAGTGIKWLGESLAAKKRPGPITLFLTHFHLDHIIGLPFFRPLYDPETILIIYSPLSPAETESHLNAVMGGRFFPVSFSATPCKKDLRTLPLRGLSLESMTVHRAPLPHSQGNIALRFEGKAGRVVFAPDAEPASSGWSQEVIDLAAGATYLIGDSMFTPEEYLQGKKGWGHGSWREAVRLAREAKGQTLILSYWNPDHSDAVVREIVREAKKEFPSVEAARPGWRRTF